MSNRTVKGATRVHGKDPQELVEKIIRERIYDSTYWKDECFEMTDDTLLEKATELEYVGGLYSNQKPVPFLCLVQKMLQIQPKIEVIHEFIQNTDFKYLTVLGLFYFRLVGSSIDIYKVLEPYLADFRKIRKRNRSGEFEITHIDVIVNDLLKSDRVFDIILPRLTKRIVFEEEIGKFRDSSLADELDESEEGSDVEVAGNESLSIEATNALRKKLGLAPLT